MKILIIITIFTLIQCRRIFPGQYKGKSPLPRQLSEVKTIKTSCNKLESYNQKVFGGYMEVGENLNSALYYVFYTAKNQKQDAPIIMWLQGGPGCSGFLGAFEELGPYELICTNGTDCMETPRTNSWNDNYHLLFVEQPVGTGYSYGANGELAITTEQAAEHLYNGLINFFGLGSGTDCDFEQYKSNDFYIFGESAAGHWIPGTAYKILKENEQAPFKINLKSVGMGNPWTDPMNQNENGLFAYTMGLINQDEREQVELIQLQANFATMTGDYQLANDLQDDFITVIQDASGGVNIYNYRVIGPYDDAYVINYLNSTSIKEKYHVPSYIKYDICNGTVFDMMYIDNVLSQAHKMPYILSKIPVLIYNGQDDIICNTPGQLNWINKLQWPGSDEFFNAPTTPWSYEQEVVGTEKQGGNLKFVIVNKAGHLVPKDQMEVSIAMVDKWINSL